MSLKIRCILKIENCAETCTDFFLVIQNNTIIITSSYLACTLCLVFEVHHGWTVTYGGVYVCQGLEYLEVHESTLTKFLIDS